MVPALIMAISASALGSALASQYWGGLLPCVLCIYQRWAYVAAFTFALAGFGLMKSTPKLLRAAIAMAGLSFMGGSIIAGFHVGVEQGWWQGFAGCHVPPLDPTLTPEQMRAQLLATEFVACDQIPWSMFGVSMAGYNALFSAAFAAATMIAAWKLPRQGA
ncbi:MAG: disulfide bond formation protein B [Alphaproteobacteria bacterium]|nr:disulfide bond formation protein B [Alphaproteobacteria bacterium]